MNCKCCGEQFEPIHGNQVYAPGHRPKPRTVAIRVSPEIADEVRHRMAQECGVHGKSGDLFSRVARKAVHHGEARVRAEWDPVPIQDRFEKWLEANPGFWPLFVWFAMEAKGSGRPRYSVKAIVERVRWETAIRIKGGDFKVNNDFSSRLARKMIAEYPQFEGFFEVRGLKRQ